MNSLRIKRTDVYEIEVNDKGETIVFDLTDIDLPFKLTKAFDGVKAAQTTLKGKIVAIEKKQDHKAKGALFSDNEIAIAKARSDAFKEMRKAMDAFLGAGACQKIFDDVNYLTMFDDLFEELNRKGEDGKSHFDRMDLTTQGIKDRIAAKYGDADESVME